MGDLNSDLLSDSDDSKFVRKLMDELSLQLVQHGPTHYHTPTSCTWIDVILVDDNDVISRASNEPAPFRSSKHNVIDVSINIHKPKEDHHPFHYRDYKNIDTEELLSFLKNCDWERFDSNNKDTETALECLCDNLMEAIDELAPLKAFKPKKGKLPWIDAEISQLRKKQNATYRRYKRTGNLDFYTEFARLRDLVELKTSESRTAYYTNKLSDAIHSNATWKELRNLGLMPKQKEDLNGISPIELNEHFAGVSISHEEDESTYHAIISSATEEDGFCFKQVTINDVILSFSHFSFQAVGEDGIPQSVILQALPVIGDKLVMLFNASLRSGTFPALWKRAHIIPQKSANYHQMLQIFDLLHYYAFFQRCWRKLSIPRSQSIFSKKIFLILVKRGSVLTTLRRQLYLN